MALKGIVLGEKKKSIASSQKLYASIYIAFLNTGIIMGNRFMTAGEGGDLM